MGIENRSCRCQLCGSDSNPTMHHIVPQCLENGRDSGEIHGDDYTRSLVNFYNNALNFVPSEKVGDFRSKIKKAIAAESNLLTLCRSCHRALHLGRIEGLDFCSHADCVPERLGSLCERDVHLFFEYLILEALVECLE